MPSLLVSGGLHGERINSVGVRRGEGAAALAFERGDHFLIVSREALRNCANTSTLTPRFNRHSRPSCACISSCQWALENTTSQRSCQLLYRRGMVAQMAHRLTKVLPRAFSATIVETSRPRIISYLRRKMASRGVKIEAVVNIVACLTVHGVRKAHQGRTVVGCSMVRGVTMSMWCVVPIPLVPLALRTIGAPWVTEGTAAPETRSASG